MRFIRPVSVNNCRIRTLYWHIPSWSGNYALGILVTFIISRTLYYGFLTSIHKVRIHRCWIAAAAFIFQVKILISKSLKSIADDRNNRSITSINNTNLVWNIICTIIFFKPMKHNMPQILTLTIHIVEKSFKKDFKKIIINETYFKELWDYRNRCQLMDKPACLYKNSQLKPFLALCGINL